MKSLVNILLVPFALGHLVVPSAHAAGFDCNNTSGFFEVEICADDTLSRADEDMNDAYTYLAAQCPDIAADAHLRTTQRHWLAKVRRDFGEGGPKRLRQLQASYRARNDVLAKLVDQCSPSHGPVEVSVKEVQDPVNNNSNGVLFVQTNPPQPGWRINRVLFKDYDGSPPSYIGGLDAFFASHGVADDGYDFYYLELILNKGNLLVVNVSGLYYEEGFPRSYPYDWRALFDVRTGNEFKITELFADASASGFKQYIREELFKMAKVQHIPVPEPDTNSQPDGHTLCINIWWKDSVGMVAQFQPDGRISIPYLTCAVGRIPNYKKGPDGRDFYHMNLSVTPSEIREFLTPYGKSLLLDEGEVLSPAH